MSHTLLMNKINNNCFQYQMTTKWSSKSQIQKLIKFPQLIIFKTKLFQNSTKRETIKKAILKKCTQIIKQIRNNFKKQITETTQAGCLTFASIKAASMTILNAQSN
jgi:hypothetical protein